MLTYVNKLEKNRLLYACVSDLWTYYGLKKKEEPDASLCTKYAEKYPQMRNE